MHKLFKNFVCLLILIMLVSVLFSSSVFAASKYEVVIEDNEDLLSDSEEALLREKMSEITKYGNVGFISARQYSMETGTYAKQEYRRLFGTDSGTLFVIDMGQRNIWIFSDGSIYRTITKPYANTITDNVYRYASREQYYECAYNTFDQIYTLLEGGRIAQPMKHISNVLIALVLAVLINFVLLIFERREKKEDTRTVMKAMTTAVGVTVLSKTLTHSRRSLHVESSGGGSSGGGGGGGGGGGSSGGGGGHSF